MYSPGQLSLPYTDIRPVRLGQNPTPAPGFTLQHDVKVNITVFRIQTSTESFLFTGQDSECGSWESFQGVCYQVNHRARRTWAEAQTECASQGGGLASITNPIQMTFVQGARCQLEQMQGARRRRLSWH